MLKTISSSKSGIISKENILQFDDDIYNKAISKHHLLYQKGIILSDFNEPRWVLSNEKKKYIVNFQLHEEELIDLCIDNDMSYSKFIYDLKVYVVLRTGTCILETLRQTVSFALEETVKSKCYSTGMISTSLSNTTVLMYYTEFVKIVAPEKAAYILECEKAIINNRIKIAEKKMQGKQPCSLNEFQSYFKFDEIIRDWWDINHDTDEAYYYFPLYLFWVLTTIIPLRVTEFCLLPYECIFEDAEKYYIVLRRSIMKGSSSAIPKIHSYTIEGEYAKHTYEIPHWLYEEINLYRQVTKEYHRNKGLLFSIDYMYSNKRFFKKKKPLQDAIFDDSFLSMLLRDFYTEVIVGEKQFIIVSEDDLMHRYQHEDGSYELYDDELMMILPKHTRHLAMINLILRGCNPMMIKEFAEHANEAMSYNYYGNITKTVRCVTKILYDKSKNKSMRKKLTNVTDINPLSVLISEDSTFVEVDEGKCYSEKFANSNMTDCYACGGECRLCRFFIPYKKDSVVVNEDHIDREMDFIVKMLSDTDINNQLSEYQLRMSTLQKDIADLATKIWQEESNNGEKS